MSVTKRQTLAIEALVRRRCDELALPQPELIRRCGYQNVLKGLRRLEQLRAGDFKKVQGLSTSFRLHSKCRKRCSNEPSKSRENFSASPKKRRGAPRSNHTPSF